MIRAPQAEDLGAVREIFREYAAWVGDSICFAAFERELSELPGPYAPPKGQLLLAEVEGAIAGCAAFRPLSEGIAEMKRLYVRPARQGCGLGRLLAAGIIAESQAAGYHLLRLDTLPWMDRAIGMYRSLGFSQIPCYADNPASAVCFELNLAMLPPSSRA